MVYTADQADKFDDWVSERGEYLKHRTAFEDWDELCSAEYAFVKIIIRELFVEMIDLAEVDKVHGTVISTRKESSP